VVDVSPPRERTQSEPPDNWPWVTVAAHRRRHGMNARGYTVTLVLLDYILSCVGFILGLLVLTGLSRVALNHFNHLEANIQHGFWYPIGIVLGFALSGGYRRNRRSPTQSTFSDMKDIVLAVSFGAFLAMTMSYIAHHFGKWAIQVPTQIIIGVIITTVLVALSRAIMRHVVLARNPQRVAIVDDGTDYERIATHLHLEHGVTLIGRIDASGTTTDQSLGSIEQIDQIVSTNRLDRIIFGSIEISTPAVEHGYRRATEIVDTALVPKMFEVISWRSRLTELSGLPLLELAPRNVSRYDRALKRAFDLVVALFALIVTLPFTLVVALVVKLTSRGPVLFRQERLGKDRRPFTILKFRTMRLDAVDEIDDVEATANDEERSPLHIQRAKHQHVSRLTPIGGFLRRTGIDEVPQFFNVLVGTMSVVGPRPFITSESEAHSAWSARRFEVHPGITGLWQVSGRNNLTEDELRQLDYLYVSSWSLWWDIKICFDTPRAMLRGLGAY
jgi:exopolysaccharide biosynthesis polyprenyl glycosylphosphotransferase